MHYSYPHRLEHLQMDSWWKEYDTIDVHLVGDKGEIKRERGTMCTFINNLWEYFIIKVCNWEENSCKGMPDIGFLLTLKLHSVLSVGSYDCTDCIDSGVVYQASWRKRKMQLDLHHFLIQVRQFFLKGLSGNSALATKQGRPYYFSPQFWGLS